MRTMTITLYNFGELSNAAQARAVENERNVMAERYMAIYARDMIAEFETELAEFGCDDLKFEWSLSYAQGDGLSFTGTIDPVTWIKKMPYGMRDFRRIFVILTRHASLYWASASFVGIPHLRNHYSHENTVKTEGDWGYMGGAGFGADLNQEMRDLIKAIEEWRRDICIDFHRRLQSDYEAHTSDEAMREYLESGYHEFTAKGKRA